MASVLKKQHKMFMLAHRMNSSVLLLESAEGKWDGNTQRFSQKIQTVIERMCCQWGRVTWPCNIQEGDFSASSGQESMEDAQHRHHLSQRLKVQSWREYFQCAAAETFA